MARRRVLVVYKKSTLERYSGVEQSRVAALLKAGDQSVAGLAHEHETHLRTVQHVRQTLEKLGANATFRHRAKAKKDQEWDLIVTLGGDGTLLWASHLANKETPIVGINSSPETSVGYFCADTSAHIEAVLQSSITGTLHESTLSRMRVSVNGEVVSSRVLNDALFCHESPAMTSRYILSHQGVSEPQVSSGLWIGPAAGSTAAIRSAGGVVLPLQSKKIQFVVREAYHPRGDAYQLAKGVAAEGQSVSLTSQISKARLYLDGTQKKHRVTLGDRVQFEISDEPLRLLGLSVRHARPQIDER